MATDWFGGTPEKFKIRLEGDKVIIEDSNTLDFSDKYSKPLKYKRLTALYFENEDQANEYYYKNR